MTAELTGNEVAVILGAMLWSLLLLIVVIREDRRADRRRRVPAVRVARQDADRMSGVRAPVAPPTPGPAPR